MKDDENRSSGSDVGAESGQRAPDERAVKDLALLEPLREVPPRAAAAVERGRELFLETARSMGPPVSPTPIVRPNMWNIFSRKERSPMFALARLALIAALVLGGAGSTVAAAQASGPADPLYPVKLWSEDLRLALTNDPQAGFDLLAGFMEERFEELAQLAEDETPIPARVSQRLQTQVQLALQQAARMDDAGLQKALERLRVMVQNQTLAMTQLQMMATEQAEQALQLSERIQAQIRSAADEAQENPESFRMRLGTERPETAPERPEQFRPGPGAPGGEGNGRGPGGDGGGAEGDSGDSCKLCTPQSTPGASEPPGKGGGYGPGSNR